MVHANELPGPYLALINWFALLLRGCIKYFQAPASGVKKNEGEVLLV
jgi:hypothetical protein